MKQLTMKNKAMIRTAGAVSMGLILILMLAVCAISFAAAATSDNNGPGALRIDFVSQTPDPVEPGSYVDLRWRVTNVGGKSVDYDFELVPQYPFSLDNPSDALITSQSVGTYQATSDGAILYYHVRVASNAVEGNTSSIKLQYYRSDHSGGVTQIEQPVRIESRQGMVNIENVRVDPSPVSVGSIFNISLDLQNFGTNFISNVKVALDSQDTGLVPYGGASQKSLARLEGQSNSTFTFQYFVDPSASIQVAQVPLTVTYFDSLGRLNNVTTSIGVQIGASPSFFPNLDRSDVFMSDSKGKVVVSISNTGRSDINFAVLELEETPDYVVVGPATSYLGNLKSDDLQTGQFDIYVKPTTASSIPLKFKLTFKDAYNQNQVEEFTLNNKLYDAATAQKIGLVQPKSYGLLVFLLIVVIVVVGIIVYRRRRKSKAKA